MNPLVNSIVRIPDSLDRRKRAVKVRFADLLAVAVDVVEPGDGVYADEVWRDAYVGAVFLVQGVQPDVPVSSKAVVELWEGGECAEGGTGEGPQGREEGVVDRDCC